MPRHERAGAEVVTLFRRGKHSKPTRIHALRSQLGTSLFRNSGFIMAATIVNGGVGFLYWTVIARTSTTHNVGLASAIVSAFTMTSLLTNIGIATLMIQALPSIYDRERWSAFVNGGILFASSFTLVISIGIGLVLPLFSANLRDLHDVVLYLTFAVGASLSTAALALDAVYVASRRSEKMLSRNMFFGISKAVIVLLPLAFVARLSTEAIVGSWVIGLFLSVLFGVVFLVPSAHDYSRWAIRGGVRAVVTLWRSLVGHHLTNLGGNLVPFILPVLVVIRVSARANAYFYVTWSVGAIFFLISPAVAASLFAEGSHGEDVLESAKKSLVIIGALLVPAIAFCCIFGREILSIFGHQYTIHGYTLLVILAFSAIPDSDHERRRECPPHPAPDPPDRDAEPRHGGGGGRVQLGHAPEVGHHRPRHRLAACAVARECRRRSAARGRSSDDRSLVGTGLNSDEGLPVRVPFGGGRGLGVVEVPGPTCRCCRVALRVRQRDIGVEDLAGIARDCRSARERRSTKTSPGRSSVTSGLAAGYSSTAAATSPPTRP